MTNEFPNPDNSEVPNYYSGGVPDPTPNQNPNPYQQQQYPAQYAQPGPSYPANNANPYQQGYPQQMANYGGMPQPTPTNKNAIISLITSLATWFILSWIPLVGFGGAIVGIVFGHKAVRETSDTPNSGRGVALTGLICGYVSLLTTIIIHFLYFFMILGLAADSTTY